MSTVYIADTGVFIRCGGSANTKYQRVRRAETALHIPRRVYEKLGAGGHSTDNEYPSYS